MVKVILNSLRRPLALLVAVHAHVQSVHLSIRVGALCGLLGSAESVVAVIAHSLGVVLLVFVGAVARRTFFLLTAGLSGPAPGFRKWSGRAI